MRASMHVRMAKRLAGGMASLPLSPKLAAYAPLASSTSLRIWLIWLLLFVPETEETLAQERTNVYYIRHSPAADRTA